MSIYSTQQNPESIFSELKNTIETQTKFFNLSTDHWIQEIDSISETYQKNLADENLQEIAFSIAQAAMEQLKKFQWILSTGKELSEQMDKATKKFTDLGDKVLSMKKDLATLIANFADNFQQLQETDSELLKYTWKEIDEIDTEFLKITALKEIEEEYNNVQNTIQRCQMEGLNIKNEINYAEECFSLSQERILAVSPPQSPGGFNPKSQIFVATAGTQNSLARIKNTIHIKYGMTCLEARIAFYLKRRFFELGGKTEEKTIQLKIEQLKTTAKEQLTWGKQGKPTPSPDMEKIEGLGFSRATTAPPMLSLKEINAIIDTFIAQAEALILDTK